MLSFLFIAYSILHLSIWFWGWREWRRQGKPAALLIVLLVNTMLWYDNFRIGIGRFVGEGDLLYAMSLPAFFWNWSFLPIMIIAAVFIGRLAGIRWAHSKVVTGLFCLAAAVFIALDMPYAISLVFGQFGALPPIELRLAGILDTIRYTTKLTPEQFLSPDAVAFSNGPAPTTAIAMNGIMILVGVFLWVKRGWKWLAVTSAIMFLVAAARPALGNLALPIANFGEIMFTFGVVGTCVHFARLDSRSKVRANPAAMPCSGQEPT